jgi:hypothetical protein
MNRPGGEPDHLPLRPLSARLRSSWRRKGVRPVTLFSAAHTANDEVDQTAKLKPDL